VADVPAEVWARWRAEEDFAPPGGESLAALDRRVRAACEDLVPAARAGTVVVFTHVSPLKAAVAWALGVGGATSWRTRVDPASVTRIDVAGPVPVLRSFNETAHLVGC
jgi:broad specificity phosphatase PhoE